MTGNIVAIAVGIGFVLAGAWLTLRVWTDEFVTLVKGSLGITLIFVGLLAAVIGFSEYRATKEFEAATSGTPEPSGEGSGGGSEGSTS